MKNVIKLLKNNEKRDWSDLEWIQEFHNFLQGDIPESITLSDDHRVKLTPEQSKAIIWYLQEHFPVFPDTIEMCNVCKEMYDSCSGGSHYEIEAKNYCDSCDYLSEATCCDECGVEVWKDEALTDEDEYLCDECKLKNKNYGK